MKKQICSFSWLNHILCKKGLKIRDGGSVWVNSNIRVFLKGQFWAQFLSKRRKPTCIQDFHDLVKIIFNSYTTGLNETNFYHYLRKCVKIFRFFWISRKLKYMTDLPNLDSNFLLDMQFNHYDHVFLKSVEKFI